MKALYCSIIFAIFLTAPGCESPPTASPAPPQADAGEDLRVQVGELAVLDGSGADAANDGQLSYAWMQLSGPVAVGIQDAGSPQALVVPEAAGVYVFRLTVTDGQGISATDEMRLIAIPGRKVGTVRITGAPLDWGVMRVEYLIAAADIDTLRGSLVITGDLVASGTVLAVEAGRDRLIELYAYDDSDRKVAFGSALIAVEESRPVEVAIEMKALLPTVGEIEIEAVFEDLGG